MNSVEEVIHLIQSRGAARYSGEAVTQREHALQCAMLAQQAGASSELIGAALLHDLGHLIQAGDGKNGMPENDDLHQYMAIPFLRPLFGSALLDPIRLHVDAKRYLCFADADYWASLSPVSQQSLQQQGGKFTAAEAAAFIQQPFARDAIRLRIWDDQAKTAGRDTPDLAHFASVLQQCVSDPRRIAGTGKPLQRRNA